MVILNILNGILVQQWRPQFSSYSLETLQQYTSQVNVERNSRIFGLLPPFQKTKWRLSPPEMGATKNFQFCFILILYALLTSLNKLLVILDMSYPKFKMAATLSARNGCNQEFLVLLYFDIICTPDQFKQTFGHFGHVLPKIQDGRHSIRQKWGQPRFFKFALFQLCEHS